MSQAFPEAQCSCGQLRAQTLSAPIRTSMCHCHACQRRTGSAFGLQARYLKDQVVVHGQAKQYVRTGDSGGKIHFSFCPECGSTVFFEVEKIPGALIVAVGAFAKGDFLPPVYSVFEDRMHPWVHVPEGAERHA